MKMEYIAMFNGDFGRGDSIEIAFRELKDTYQSDIDVEEVEFYKAVPIKVKMFLEKIKTVKESLVEERGEDLDIDLRPKESLIAQQLNSGRKNIW